MDGFFIVLKSPCVESEDTSFRISGIQRASKIDGFIAIAVQKYPCAESSGPAELYYLRVSGP
jgi:hypothetical protein